MKYSIAMTLILLVMTSCSVASRTDSQAIPQSSYKEPATPLSPESKNVNEGSHLVNGTLTDQVDARLKGAGAHALYSRLLFLDTSQLAWLQKSNGVSETELGTISKAGLLPFWVLDPFSGKPITILRGSSPIGTQIAYWTVENQAWDFSVITNTELHDLSALPVRTEDSSSVMSTYQIMSSKRQSDPAVAAAMSDDDWDVMIWALIETTHQMMSFYAKDHGKIALNLEELLNNHYVINEDFLMKVKDMVNAGAFASFECGVIQDRNIFYFDYQKRQGDSIPVAFKYEFGPNDDTLNPKAFMLNSVRPPVMRTVFLTTDMLANYESAIPQNLRTPLSSFYNPPE